MLISLALYTGPNLDQLLLLAAVSLKKMVFMNVSERYLDYRFLDGSSMSCFSLHE